MKKKRRFAPMFSFFRCVPDADASIAARMQTVEWNATRRRARNDPLAPTEALLELSRRWEEARTWDQDTPALGPCLIEITLKGWPDEAAAAALRKKRWGDFHRYMAVHLLGELRFNEATDYLLEVLKDGRADRCLRAHAARALSKVADRRQLNYFIDRACLEDLPQVIYEEIQLKNFESRDVVRVITERLPRVERPEVRRNMIGCMITHAGRNRRAIPATLRSLEKILASEKDASVRLLARKARDKFTNVGPETRSLENTTLEFDDCLPPDDWEVMYAASRGKAAPAALAAAQKRYLRIVDKIAAQYTGGNAFATRKLHNEGWPGSVTDAKARAFFQAAAGLAVGISEAEALRALGTTEEEIDRGDPDVSLGKRIARRCIRRSFDGDVEGPYGRRRSWNEVLLVFVDGKLRLVHAPQR